MRKYVLIGAAAAVLAWSVGCAGPAGNGNQGVNAGMEGGTEESFDPAGYEEGAESPDGAGADGTEKEQEDPESGGEAGGGKDVKTEGSGLSSDGARFAFNNTDMVDAEKVNACEEFARMAESYMEAPALESVTNEQVEELTELLTGHYEVAGRSDGAGREYYVALRRQDAPRYDDFHSLSAGYVGGPDYAAEVCQIGYYDENINETVLYEIPEYSLKIFEDPETAEVLDMLCFVPCDALDDRYFMDALDESGRMELDFVRKHPGVSFCDSDVPALTFLYQDEETVEFWSGLYECSIALDEKECREIRKLLEGGEEREKKVFGSEEEAFKWARGRDSSVRTTGASLGLGEDLYRFLGSRDCRGYVMTYESDKICLEYNEPAFSWVTDRIETVMGRNYGNFTDTWFDVPLTSASLKFPRHVSGADGACTLETGFQTVTEPEKLQTLAGLLGKAIRGHEALSGCPYTGVLNLVREDGETLQMFVAADSCDSVSYEGRIGFEYGKQEELAEIFDEAMR